MFKGITGEVENAHHILENAANRALHFSTALAWYGGQLKVDASFQSQFLALTNELVCSVRSESSARQVFFMAVGKSAQVACLAVSMLVSVGILARFIHPTEAFHGDLGAVKKHDVIVFISNNGRSSELVQLLSVLKERQICLYVMTSSHDSPLAQAAHHVLLIPPISEMCPLEQSPLTSTVTTLALCQLLVAATVEARNFSLEEYAKNHPGGAIGKRIFLKIDDLMHQKEFLPQIMPDAPFQKVVSVFTRFSKAALLVVEKKKFLGLITERDLRKAMENNGAKVFELSARDMMNERPKMVLPGMLAADAMDFMAQQNPPLNVLPIVDKEGNAVGLVHLQDFMIAGVIPRR